MKPPDKLRDLVLVYQKESSPTVFRSILFLIDDLLVKYTNELSEKKYDFIEIQELYHLGIVALSKALKAFNAQRYSIECLPYYVKRYFQQEVKSFCVQRKNRIDKEASAKRYVPDFMSAIVKKVIAESIEEIIKELCKENKLTPLDISLFRDKVIEGEKLKDLEQKYSKQGIFIRKRLERMIRLIKKVRKRKALFYFLKNVK